MIHLLAAFIALLFIGMGWAYYEYWHSVVLPVNRDILEGVFSNRAEILREKILNAKSYNDCRKIQSNLLAMQKKYGGKVRERIMAPVMRKLWGMLDCRVRLLMYRERQSTKEIEIGTITINDLI